MKDNQKEEKDGMNQDYNKVNAKLLSILAYIGPLFIMGKDKAAEYWRAHSDEFDTILEDEDGILYVTEGIADDFTSDHETNIIRKDGDT